MIYSVGHFTYLVLILLFDFVIGIVVDCWNTVVNKISNTFSDFEFRSLQLTSSPVICVCVTGEQETQTLIHYSLSWNDKPSLTRHFILAIEVHVPSRWQCKMFAHSPFIFVRSCFQSEYAWYIYSWVSINNQPTDSAFFWRRPLADLCLCC